MEFLLERKWKYFLSNSALIAYTKKKYASVLSVEAWL